MLCDCHDSQTLLYADTPLDCEMSAWSPWGLCKGKCGDSGVQHRTRYVIMHPANNGVACPLLEIPLIVFQTDVDALSEVVRVRNSPEEVGLNQGDVKQLRGASCSSFRTTWFQENLRSTHTQVGRRQKETE